MNDFAVFKIRMRNGECRFVIAPESLKWQILNNLPDGEYFISCFSLRQLIGGPTEIKFGNDLLNDFICKAIDGDRENLQIIFNDTLTKEVRNV